MKKKSVQKKTSSPSRVERYTVGDGLTKREMVSVTGLQNPSPEALAAIDAIFMSIGKVSTFDGRIRSPEKWAQDTLARDPDAKRLPYESEAWYAAEILSEGGLLRKIMARVQADPEAARKETDALAKFAFELGVLASEAAHKFNFESDTLLGQGDRQTRRRGGLTTGQQTREAAAERNAEVLRLNTELASRHPAERKRAAIIARKTKRPEDTIRDILKRSR